MYDPTSSPQQSTTPVNDRRDHQRHRLPPSISGHEQVPMMESRMGADEVLVGRMSWSASFEQWGGAVHWEQRARSNSTVALIPGDDVGEEGRGRRKFSELFGLGGKRGEGREKEVVRKRKASRRLSEMVGFGSGGGGGGEKGGDEECEKNGWFRRLSSIAWRKKGKRPTRKDSAWPAAVADAGKELEFAPVVPQNTATEVINYPYLSQASQCGCRRSHDAETVSDHWTPGHSPAHSETNLLGPESESLDQQEDTARLLEYLPQLERCRKESQWQELQRASSNLILAHHAITPPHTISPAAELKMLHQRARRSLERVQQAFDEGRFSEENITQTFNDDRTSSPEAQANARDDYLRVVAAKRDERDDEFEQFMAQHKRREDGGRLRKVPVADRSRRNAGEEEQSKRSVGSEMAQLAGVIGSSMQQAHTFM